MTSTLPPDVSYKHQPESPVVQVPLDKLATEWLRTSQSSRDAYTLTRSVLLLLDGKPATARIEPSPGEWHNLITGSEARLPGQHPDTRILLTFQFPGPDDKSHKCTLSLFAGPLSQQENQRWMLCGSVTMRTWHFEKALNPMPGAEFRPFASHLLSALLSAVEWKQDEESSRYYIQERPEFMEIQESEGIMKRGVQELWVAGKWANPRSIGWMYFETRRAASSASMSVQPVSGH